MSAPVRITLGVPNDSKPIPVSVASNKQRKQIDVTAPINAEKVPKYEGPYSVTPTESVHTLETDGKRMTDDVSVGAIPSNYVGSGVTRLTPSDLSVLIQTVVGQGQYALIKTNPGYYQYQTRQYIDNIPATTYTPSRETQIIPKKNYLTGDQTIKGDANLLPENIKKGVTIFNVVGTYDGG